MLWRCQWSSASYDTCSERSVTLELLFTVPVRLEAFGTRQFVGLPGTHRNLLVTMASFTCISCHVAFREAAVQREHYKSDWHRYNLKRKVGRKFSRVFNQ